MRYLVHVKVEWDDNIWSFKPISDRGDNQFSFKASESQVKKLLRRIKAKDDITNPKSEKKVSYQKMIDEIKTGRDNLIYVWSEKYPKSLDAIKGMLK